MTDSPQGNVRQENSPREPLDETAVESRVDQALADYYRRCDVGNVDRQAFLREYPDIADKLHELLDTSDLIGVMAGPTAAESTTEFSQSAEFSETVIYSEIPVQPPLRSEKPTPRQPDLLGDYELLEEVGRGGMGVVYRARQISLDRIVAVKMILERRLSSAEDVARFYAEAKAAGRIKHPNIVNVHQVGQIDGRHFFAMDYIAGKTLAEMIHEGPLDDEQASILLKTIAESVHDAHENGILHRDLKPANVIVDESGAPHITDFGLAKQVDEEVGLTSTGAAVGTPSYMAPEQAACRRDEVGPATDVYSMGAVLYAMLTGEPPFRGENVTDTLMQVLHRQPTSVRAKNNRVSRDLEAICLKCLRKSPRRRYRTAQKLADDLERFLASAPVTAKPPSRAGAVWGWLCEVPIIAVLVGGKPLSPTPWQQRANYLFTAAVLLLVGLLATILLWRLAPTPLERRIRIAAASEQTPYYHHAKSLTEHLRLHTDRPVKVLVTHGSENNRRLLLDKQAEVAFLQSSTVSGDTVLAAPLYVETLYVLGAEIDSLAELQAGDRVYMGPQGSANRKVAGVVLASFGISEKNLQNSDTFLEDFRDRDLQAALVLTEPSNPLLNELLRSKTVKLIGIPPEIIDQLSRRRSLDLNPTHIGENGQYDAGGVLGIEAPSFVVVRRDASPQLVELLLQSMYGSNGLAKKNSFFVQLEEVQQEWKNVNFHPAARRWYSRQPTQSP